MTSNGNSDWDIKTRNLTSSIFSAVLRYQTIKGVLPFSSDIYIIKISENPVYSFINQLVQEGELNPEDSHFLTPEYTSDIYFSYSSSSKTIKYVSNQRQIKCKKIRIQNMIRQQILSLDANPWIQKVNHAIGV